MKKRFFRIVIQLGLIFVFLEVGLMLVTKANVIDLEEPIYTFENSRRYWAEIDTTFGIWRPSDYHFRHKKTCFDVIYETNSIGARDRERTVSSSNQSRVVVIGDSFAEGWGVNVEDRFSNILEENTGRPFLNFAVGSAGMTQEYLIYQQKAMPYEHEAVLWMVFPINDLIDDDIDFHAKYSYDRYRAYWVGEYPDYHIEHGLQSLEQSHYYLEKPERLKVLLKNFTYTYNLLRWMKYRKRVSDKPKFDPTNEPGYFQFNAGQWNRIRFNIEQMKKLIGDKKLYLVTLPGEHTFREYQANGGSLPLVDSLKGLSQTLDFEYLDLLTDGDAAAETDWVSYYYDFKCDAHWNEQGHQWAAKSIMEAFSF